MPEKEERGQNQQKIWEPGKQAVTQEWDRRIFAAKYFEGYELQSVPKRHGSGMKTVRVYVGDAYLPETSPESVRQIKWIYATGMLMIFFLLLLGGMWKGPVNNTAIVVLPYVVALIGAGLMLVGIVRFLGMKGKMTRYSYDRYCRETLYGVSAVLAGMTASVAAVLILWFRKGIVLASAGDYLIPSGCFALCAEVAYALRKVFKKLNFREEKGREPFSSLKEEEDPAE